MPVFTNFSDQELIEAVQSPQGVNQAIAFLYKNHYRLLERYVLNNSGDSADAQDVIQEVMVSFVELVQQGKYRGEASVKSFLYTLLRNLWITELRKKGANSKRHELYENGREQWDQDVSEHLVYKEAQKTVLALFDQIGEGCRKILTLFYYDNLSMKEILEHTNYDSEQVLRNKKYKCLKEITDLLQKNPAISENVKSALQRLQ
jgi:RNA polymerase sigma factor (sigma-70 family)